MARDRIRNPGTEPNSGGPGRSQGQRHVGIASKVLRIDYQLAVPTARLRSFRRIERVLWVRVGQRPKFHTIVPVTVEPGIFH